MKDYKGIKDLKAFIILKVLIIIPLLLSACARPALVTTDRRDTVRIHTRDTVRLARTVTDTVFRLDSVFQTLERKGDTVYLTRERWRDRYKTVVRAETIYRAAARDTLAARALAVKETPPSPPPFPAKGFTLVILLAAAAAAVWIKNTRRNP